MASKNLLYSYFISCLFVSSTHADTWKLFFYMDSSDKLSDMAWKNITDMMRGSPTQSVEVVLQLHAYTNVALRYVLDHSALKFVEEVVLTNEPKQDFIDAVTWAFTDTHADHTMLIFANHGWGAIDPQWNPVTEKWEAAELSMPPADTASCALVATIPKKSVTSWEYHHKKHRAFMFDGVARTCLSNADMVAGLEHIHEHVLHKKKVDIIAFDTCMGCMLEIASYVAPYGDYLVGVQSCALVDGFDYQGFMAALNKGNNAHDTCIEFIQAFDEYYTIHDQAGIYTCTALDLSLMDEMNENLNKVVHHLVQHPEYIPFIRKARDESPRFCLWPIYSDVVAFLKLVEHNLMEHYTIADNDELRRLLHDFYDSVHHAVVARCGGYTTEGKAHGIAIYLPHAILDASYTTCQFAQISLWIDLLQAITG